MQKKNVNVKDSGISTVQNTNFDTPILFFIGCLLSIDFFPNFGSIEVIAPQYLFLSLLNIVMALYIYMNQEIVTKGVFQMFKNSISFKFYFLFLLGCFISIFTAKNSSLAIKSFLQLIVIFGLVVNFSIVLYRRNYLLTKIILLVGFVTFFQSFTTVISFLKQVTKESLEIALGNLKGNTGNINIMAASMAIKVSFLFVGILRFTSWTKYFLSITVLFSTLIIFLISSRATLISLSLITIITLILGYKKFSTKIDFTKKIALVIVPLLFSFVIANQLFSTLKSGSIRYKSVEDRITQIQVTNITDASATARLTFWKNASKLIIQNPIAGVGLGNWLVESIYYDSKSMNNMLISVHAHNDFIEIMAETGLINGLIYLGMFLIIFIITLKRVLKKSDSNTKDMALLALLLLVVYGVDSLLNFPLYRPTMQIGLCLLLVFTLVNTNYQEATNKIPNLKYVFTTMTLLFAIVTFGNYKIFKANQFESTIRTDFASTVHLLTPEAIKKEMPLFPNVFTNSEPYLEHLAIYYWLDNNSKEAEKYFLESLKINPYTGRSDWYLYKIAEKNKQKKKAFFYAKNAFLCSPRTEGYFISVLKVTSEKKDTLQLLKFHEMHNKYLPNPANYINTSSALAQSNYSLINMMVFMDKGLKQFPNDITLVDRKKSFLNNHTDGASYIKKNNIPKNTIVKDDSASKKALLNQNYINQANLEFSKGNFNKAVEYYEVALKAYPDNRPIMQNVGIGYFKLNDFKKAIYFLEKALNAPELNDGKTEYILGACYLNTNNNTKACSILKISSQKNYIGAQELITKFCK